MKVNASCRKTRKPICPAYPNAAGRDYYIQKLLDIATAIISGLGLMVSIVFLASIT